MHLRFNGSRFWPFNRLRFDLAQTEVLPPTLTDIEFDGDCACQWVIHLDRSDCHVEPAFAQGMQLDPLLLEVVDQAELEVLRFQCAVAVNEVEHLGVYLQDWEGWAWHLHWVDEDAFDLNRVFELETSFGALEGAPDVKFMLSIDTRREIPAAKVYNG